MLYATRSLEQKSTTRVFFMTSALIYVLHLLHPSFLAQEAAVLSINIDNQLQYQFGKH